MIQATLPIDECHCPACGGDVTYVPEGQQPRRFFVDNFVRRGYADIETVLVPTRFYACDRCEWVSTRKPSS